MSWSADGGWPSDPLPAYGRSPVATEDQPWFGRRGRFTPAKLDEFARLYERYGLASGEAIRGWRPQVLDIGFGAGDSVVGQAMADPTCRVLGIETFAPGVLTLMRRLEAEDLDGVRVTRANVVAVLPQLEPGQLRLARVLFPDPWPKRRHAERRLVGDRFVARLADLLAPGGVLQIATDVAAYAVEIRAVVARCDGLVPAVPPARSSTRFEAHAARDGRAVTDLAWRRAT